MSHPTFWCETADLKRYPALTKDIQVDVLVIGGGLMGITAAYLLSKAGQRVALIERDTVASGDTGRTTAHLTAVMDTRLAELAKTFGDDGARRLWDAGEAAIHQIGEIGNQCVAECDVTGVPGFLHLSTADDGRQLESLQADVETASRLGISAELVKEVPFFKVPGIRFPNQARFHPGKYLGSLLQALESLGGAVYENSNADEFADDGRLVRVGKAGISAAKTIIATHTPLMGTSGALGATLFQTKLYLYTSYVVCAKIPKGSFPDGLFWDTADPYNYARIQPASEADYLIYGGRDHKTGQEDDTEAVFAALEAQAAKLLAARGINGRMVGRWSGQVIETNDGAPFIGENAGNQFAATGFGGNGMTFGTLGAMMAADWALGQQDPWTELLSPSRKKVFGGTLEYIKQNVDFPYYMVADRLKATEDGSAEEVASGEGKILGVDGERRAVYRDESGRVHQLSPICTHLGCVVHWNGAEKSWDCPCHGSRFRPTGEVIGGPAETPLERK